MDTQETGRLIARRRKALGLSQAEVAQRLHVTDKAVSKWETGRGMPGIDNLAPLAEALGLSVVELLDGAELTAEELPKTAGEQLVKTLRAGKRMAWRGALAAVLAVALVAGIYVGSHWLSTVAETDSSGLERQAAAYLGRPKRMFIPDFDYESLRIVETQRRGDYLAALCTDDKGNWSMCVYDRDALFPDRWRGNGGKPQIDDGELVSWNFGHSREAVIIFCGGDLPPEARYYTFQNSGITYTCPIEDGQVLDVFLLPDTADISSFPKALLDGEGAVLEG